MGRIVALLVIAFGLMTLFARGDIGGLWLAIIGWFVLEAARAEIAALPRSAFRGATSRAR
jgi:hypothetical protein